MNNKKPFCAMVATFFYTAMSGKMESEVLHVYGNYGQTDLTKWVDILQDRNAASILGHIHLLSVSGVPIDLVINKEPTQ